MDKRIARSRIINESCPYIDIPKCQSRTFEIVFSASASRRVAEGERRSSCQSYCHCIPVDPRDPRGYTQRLHQAGACSWISASSHFSACGTSNKAVPRIRHRVGIQGSTAVKPVFWRSRCRIANNVFETDSGRRLDVFNTHTTSTQRHTMGENLVAGLGIGS